MFNGTDYVYFIFSSEQYELKKKVEAKLGRRYNPGWVIQNGKRKLYTDIVTDLTSIKYTDYIIQAQGLLKEIKYDNN